MKSIRSVLLGAGIIGALGLGVAETSAQSGNDLQAMIEAAETTTPYPASEAPAYGNYYSAQMGAKFPPMPSDWMNLPFWSLGNGLYVYDDRNVDYAALREAASEAAAATPNNRFAMAASSLLNTAFAYGNPVYLTNMAATNAGSSMTASFRIAGGTNFVPYDILMGTNVANPVSSWTWLGIGYTSNNYTFSNQPMAQAFYILGKPQNTMTVPWGDDSYGQCSTMPLDLTNVIAVSAGLTHSLALKNDGTVVTWGWPYDGGNYVPTNVTGGIIAIAAGWAYNVAVLTNGNVIAWGDIVPSYPEAAATNVPASATNVSIVAACSFHSLALRNDGTLVGWGYYSPDNGEQPPPDNLSNIVAIAAGPDHDLAVQSDGSVVAWGTNDSGQCTAPAGLSNVVDVAAGWKYSLALKNDGTVAAWGDNTFGETNVPSGLSNVVAIAAGGDPFASDLVFYPAAETAYGLALRSDGSVVAWGDGPVTNLPAGMTGVFAIAGGTYHGIALRTGPLNPVIIEQPADQYQLIGGTATFDAVGLGVAEIIYQWQLNAVNITGATNATLALTNVQSWQFGSYDVVVTDNGGRGSIVSSNANLNFLTPPTILSQTLPTNQIVAYETNVTLSVTATGAAETNGFPLSYQWQFDGVNVSGATRSSYTFAATNSGIYLVNVNNAAGSTNAAWQITVEDSTGLLFVDQPADRYQIAGGGVTFNASAVSSNAVTYQWQFEGTNIAGATDETLTLTNVQVAQQGVYDVVASDSAHSLTSSNANFVLVTSPTISSQTLPTNQTVYYQGAVALSITASAPGQANGFPIACQWQFNGTNISGATNNFYTVLAGAGSAGTYSIAMTNAAGSTNAAWDVTIDYGTLAYYLATNAVAYASGRSGSLSDLLILSNWTYATYSGTNFALLTNAVWSTDCWLHGVQGLSATAIGYSNDLGGQTLITMVSPRHYLRAHHVGPPSGVLVFLDTNNVIYLRNYVQEVEVDSSDTDVGVLDSDLPASVGFQPVVPTNLLSYVPTNATETVQGIGMNQSQFLFSQPMSFDPSGTLTWNPEIAVPFGLGTNWNVTIRGGDSSDPEMFLVGNQLVLLSHNFQTFDGPNYALQFDGINEQMHYLSTNNGLVTDYQLTSFLLTNWPTIH